MPSIDLAKELKRDERGVFHMRPYLGTNVITGEPIRPYKSWSNAKTEEEALVLAQQWINTIADAADMHVNQRVGELAALYIEFLRIENGSPNTIKTYRTCLKRYVDPYIGALDPREVKSYMIEGLYSVLALKGSRKGEAIAPATILKTHWFLRGAFNWFVGKGVCVNNPTLAVMKPSPDTTDAIAYNEDEYRTIQRALLDALKEPAESSEAIFRKNAVFAAHLALNTGERCGEITANNRSDAQLFRQNMRVCANTIEEPGRCFRRPKTKGKKTRNVSIDETLCEDIRRHYEWQATYLSKAKQDSSQTFICTTADGKIMRPSKVSEAFSEMRDRLGLPKNTTFHTLRHTHATWLLMDGVDMRTIQERLGHYDVSITLRLYSHVMQGRDQAAAQAFANRRNQLRGL